MTKIREMCIHRFIVRLVGEIASRCVNRMAAACEKPHCVAIAAHDQPIAVVLDLMHPSGRGWRLGGQRRNAGARSADN
jgi:hypothetical protein